MAAYVLHYFQSLSGFFVHELEFSLFSYLVAELEYEVTRMRQMLRLLEFLSAGFPEQFAYLCLKFREFVPGLENLSVVAE